MVRFPFIVPPRRAASRPRAAAVALILAVLVNAPLAATAEVLRLRGVEYLGDLPTLVADARGYFDGIAVRVDYGASGKANLASLRAGEVDLTVMAMTPLVVDRLRDATPGGDDDPVVLANLAYSTKINHVVTLAPADAWPPARVGLARGTNAEFLWSLFAAYHGLDPGEVASVDLPIARLGDALADGTVAAAVVWEPWTSRLRARFGDDLRVVSGSTAYTTRWLLVTRREVVRDCEHRCRDLIAAYRRAERAIEADPTAARALFAERWDVPAAVMDELPRLPIYDVTLDWTVFTSFRQQVAWARRAGYARTDGPVSIFTVLAPEPLAAVAPQAVLLPLAPAASGEGSVR